MIVTPEVLIEFKKRMHITHNDDDNLTNTLRKSAAYIKTKCGDFTFQAEEATELDVMAQELVFERSRFAYNDALEYFEDAFQSELTGLGIAMALKVGDYDETIIQATKNQLR